METPREYWTKNGYVYATKSELIERQTWWQEEGLMQTASGYGNRLLTSWMIRDNGRLKRIYAICYSNVSTLYILRNGKRVLVQIDD